MVAIVPKELAARRAASESTTATDVMVVAEQALESAPSVSVAAVEEETFPLPTRKTMPIEVARRGSNQVVNPATRLKIELAYSAA